METISAIKRFPSQGYHRTTESLNWKLDRDSSRKRLKRYSAPTVKSELNALRAKLEALTDPVAKSSCMKAIAKLVIASEPKLFLGRK